MPKPRLDPDVRRAVDAWVGESTRIAYVESVLRDVKISVDPLVPGRKPKDLAIGVLEDVAREVRSARPESAREVGPMLDRLLDEKLSFLETPLPPRVTRQDDVFSEDSATTVVMPDIGDEERVILRGFIEANVIDVARRDTWVIAGLLSYLVVASRTSPVSDPRLPWPKQGVEPARAPWWPALWLSGQRNVFPLANGKDPCARTRSNRLQKLRAAYERMLIRATDLGEMVRDESDD